MTLLLIPLIGLALVGLGFAIHPIAGGVAALAVVVYGLWRMARLLDEEDHW